MPQIVHKTLAKYVCCAVCCCLAAITRCTPSPVLATIWPPSTWLQWAAAAQLSVSLSALLLSAPLSSVLADAERVSALSLLVRWPLMEDHLIRTTKPALVGLEPLFGLRTGFILFAIMESKAIV